MQANNVQKLREALAELRNRLNYFCLQINGEYSPLWATELVGIIDTALAAPPERELVGNAAVMLEILRLIMFKTGCLSECHTIDFFAQKYIADIRELVNEALAVPPRNCDVGTPEEQAERFIEHCQSYQNRDGIKTCTGCPCCGVVMYGKCEFAWAQMSYE